MIFLLLLSSVQGAFHEDLLHVPKAACYSCASFAYLPLWDQLMHHYFPPKNFTDRCWQPDTSIGVVSCSSACFTLVERIDQRDEFSFMSDVHGVLRGCVDRLLLFGLDDDIRNVLTTSYQQRVCRETDRKILRLYPLSGNTQLVTFCSCTGEHCNDQDMLQMLNGSSFDTFNPFVLAVLLFYLLLR